MQARRERDGPRCTRSPRPASPANATPSLLPPLPLFPTLLSTHRINNGRRRWIVRAALRLLGRRLTAQGLRPGLTLFSSFLALPGALSFLARSDLVTRTPVCVHHALQQDLRNLRQVGACPFILLRLGAAASSRPDAGSFGLKADLDR